MGRLEEAVGGGNLLRAIRASQTVDSQQPFVRAPKLAQKMPRLKRLGLQDQKAAVVAAIEKPASRSSSRRFERRGNLGQIDRTSVNVPITHKIAVARPVG